MAGRTCVVVAHVWHRRGMHGGGQHAWRGWEMATEAGVTHTIEMHSCLINF